MSDGIQPVYSNDPSLFQLFHQLRHNQINVYFAGAKGSSAPPIPTHPTLTSNLVCSAPVRDMLELCEFYNSVPREHFYPTIHDAVLAAIDKKRLYIRKRGISEPIMMNQAGLTSRDGSFMARSSDPRDSAHHHQQAQKKHSCHPLLSVESSEGGVREKLGSWSENDAEAGAVAATPVDVRDVMTSTTEIPLTLLPPPVMGRGMRKRTDELDDV